MSNVTSTFRSAGSSATTPTIYNVSALVAGTEYSQALSPSTKSFIIKVRGSARLQLSFVSGQSGTNFITVPRGAAYTQDGLNYSGTLYFQTNEASQIIEIAEWS